MGKKFDNLWFDNGILKFREAVSARNSKIQRILAKVCWGGPAKNFDIAPLNREFGISVSRLLFETTWLFLLEKKVVFMLPHGGQKLPGTLTVTWGAAQNGRSITKGRPVYFKPLSLSVGVPKFSFSLIEIFLIFFCVLYQFLNHQAATDKKVTVHFAHCKCHEF